MTAMASVGTDAKTLYPQQWEGIISSALDESDADLFLSTFEAMIDPHYLPYTSVCDHGANLNRAVTDQCEQY